MATRVVGNASGENTLGTRLGRRRASRVYLILVLALALRSFHLGYPAWDYHNWRQTITLMVARDFARNGFHLLHPQVAWINTRPSDPSYFSAEFSLESVFAAVLYKAVGESEIAARLVIVGFSLLGIWCLYSFVERHSGRSAALCSAFVYALVPYHLFFGRAFMPDVPALSLAIASLDVLDRWTDIRRSGWLIGAGVLAALAVLQKPRMVLIAVPAVYLFWSAYGRAILRRRDPYIFFLIACFPELAWFAHGLSMEAQTAVSAFNIPGELFATHLWLWLQPQYWQRVLGALAFEGFSPFGLVLALAGFVLPACDRSVWLARWWIGGAALVLLPIPAVIPDNLYYLSMFMPAGATLAGVAVSRLRRQFRVIALIVFATGAIHSAIPLYQADRMPYDLGILLRDITAPGDLVATEAGGSPAVLYHADRRGFLMEREYNVNRVQQLELGGPRYYADTFAGDFAQQRTFFRAMDARFQRLTNDDAPWQIYDLAATTGPLRSGFSDLPKSRGVEFGDEIRLRGISLRRLAGSPSSFEVVYEWRCMKPLTTNLRVFVHIVNRDGNTVAQQDHWPQAGRFPTLEWKREDLVRERYVLVVPDSLPAGNYRIFAGWFDPASGRRLPVVNGTASDEPDRANIAEISVGHQPRYGWFSPH